MTDTMKTVDNIHNELLAEIPDKYQKTIGFPMWDILRAVAIGFKFLWDLCIEILNKHDVRNMKGEELRHYISQHRNVQWKEGTFSSGYLTLKGNFEIEKGDIFQNSAGLNYEAIDNIKSDNGTAKVFVQCLTKGSAGNCGVDSINIMPVVLSGVTSATNEEPFTNGYDDETDEELITRYFEDIKTPLTSGNIYHYKKWAKDVQGVGDAKVFPLWNGDNTVKVLIIDSNKRPANSGLIKSVQDYIDPYEELEEGTKKGWGCGNGQAPIGAYCTVESAEPLNLDVSFTAKKTAISDEKTVIANTRTEIENYLKSIAFKNDSVSYAQTGSSILKASGIIDYSELMINKNKTNIRVEETQIAILNDLKITFEE